MENNNTTKGDILSCLSLLVLGIVVFFGLLFKTGDTVQSALLSVVIFALLMVFVFFAAFAKKQNKDQSMWSIVKMVLVILYAITLIPCYFYSARFFDIQFKKDSINEKVQNDADALNSLFDSYSKKCDSRISAYQVNLEAMVTSEEGRKEIAGYLNLGDGAEVSDENVSAAVASFSKMLKGAKYKDLLRSKDSEVSKALAAFKNWNLLSLHQTASDLSLAYPKYSKALEKLYVEHDNPIEKQKSEFEAAEYSSGVKQAFISPVGFSVMGLLATLFLGVLGLTKYLTGKKSVFSEIVNGDASEIEQDGGMRIR